MNKVFRKVLFTIIMIIICGGVFLLSVFTWFNNKEVVPKNVDINITSLDNISFSIDKKEFYKNLDVNSFKKIPSTLEGVSCNPVVSEKGDVSFYKKSNYMDGDKEYVIYKKDNNNNLKLEFYIKSDKDRELYLSNLSNVLIDSFDKSVRVLFVSDNTSRFLWEPNNDIHEELGVHKALVFYDKIIGIGPGEEKIPYYAVSKEIKKEDKVLINKYNLDYYTLVSSGNSFADKSDLKIMDISKGVSKIDVYLWIESEDVDYDEELLFKGLQLNLLFSTK